MPLRKADCEPKFREWLMPTTRRSFREMRADHLLAVVGAAIVDEDDLEVDVQLGERGLEPLVHDRNRQVVLVAGDDRADAVDGVQTDISWTTARSAACREAPRTMSMVFWRPSSNVGARLPAQVLAGLLDIGVPVLNVPLSLGHREGRLRRDAEQLAGRRGDLADRGLAPGADVERLAVIGRAQIERSVDECFGHVVHIDEITRNGRIDEIGVACLPVRGESGWESAGTSLRAGRKPSRGAGSRTGNAFACRSSRSGWPWRPWTRRSRCWERSGPPRRGPAALSPYSEELPACT